MLFSLTTQNSPKTLLGDIEAPAVIITKVAHWDVCISVLHVEHIWL